MLTQRRIRLALAFIMRRLRKLALDELRWKGRRMLRMSRHHLWRQHVLESRLRHQQAYGQTLE